MKRFMVSVVLGAGLLLGGCTQQAAATLPAGLQGTYDLTLVNDNLLFVTSTDRNELRVLRLSTEAGRLGYVRAPNPLEPLAIPVLPRPQALTRDVRYDAAGVEKSGAYVYARSNGSTLISVVDSVEARLREVARLDSRQLSANASSGPVTAFAALAAGQEGEPSTLYFATQEPAGARLWRVRLPTVVRELEEARATLAAELLVELASDEAVSSLLVLPQVNQLAVSTRRGQPGNPGVSFLLDVTTLERQALDFGGSQVLQLVTHGRLPGDLNLPGRLEGSRIFGVLDASNCTQPAAPAPSVACRTGVLAVDRVTRAVANDFTGSPMFPLNWGAGLPMGLSLSTSTTLSRQAGEDREVSVPLLGMVPLSTGGILFFDALNLVHFNTDPRRIVAEAKDKATAAVALLDQLNANVDASAPDRRADIAFTGTYGVTRDEQYVLASQGVLPGTSRLERGADPATFQVPVVDSLEEDGLLASVRPGDVLVLLPEDPAQPGCGTDVVVAEVQRASPTAPTAILVPAGALPEACADFPRFEVRAAGARSLVLTTSAGNYLRRMGTGSTYSRVDTYFIHPPGYTGQVDNTAVSLTITRDLTQSPVARGHRFLVTVASNFFPYLLSVDLVTYSALWDFRLPGPLVRGRVGETDYAYIVYPSANAVLQMNLSTVVSGAANSLGLVPYR
ncbi:MAG: hypothetical protein ABW123_13345 [Cystobacter sp.]